MDQMKGTRGLDYIDPTIRTGSSGDNPKRRPDKTKSHTQRRGRINRAGDEDAEGGRKIQLLHQPAESREQ